MNYQADKNDLQWQVYNLLNKKWMELLNFKEMIDRAFVTPGNR